MRISDWSSDVCSSDLETALGLRRLVRLVPGAPQILDQLAELGLPLLQLGDVREHPGDAAILHAPFADLEPAAVAPLLPHRARRVPVPLPAAPHPFFEIALGLCAEPGFGGCADVLLQSISRLLPQVPGCDPFPPPPS